MSSGIPQYAEIEKLLIESGKIKKAEIPKELEKIREAFQGFIQSKNVLAFQLAKRLGIEISLFPKVESVTLSRLPKAPTDDYFNVVGYAVQIRAGTTKNKKKKLDVTLVDETGYVQGTAYGEALKAFETSGVVRGDLIEISNARVEFWRDGVPRLALFGNNVSVSKAMNTLKPLSEFAAKDELSGLGNEYYVLTAFCHGVRFRKYFGCPVCMKKVEGGMIGATSPCCNASITEHVWQTLSLVSSDGLSGVNVLLAPKLTEDKDEDYYVDKVVRAEGIYSTKDKELKAIAIDVVPLDKKFAGFFGEKLA